MLPRLKPTIELVPAPDGRLYLYRGGSQDFSVADLPPVRWLLERLDGAILSPELIDAASAAGLDGEEVGDAIVELYALGLVDDAAADATLPPPARDRFDRQLRYFGDLAPPRAARAVYQRRLAESRVVVLGLGGLGGNIALALASAGVGAIDGVDGDQVELSNLNRQLLYRERDVGRSKVQAASDALAAFNSSVRFRPVECWLESERDVAEVVAGADMVVDAVDYPPHRIEAWVNRACFAADVPYVMMSQFPPLVRLGPTFVPGHTGCYQCQERDWQQQHPLLGALVAAREGVASPAASTGPACTLVAAQIAVDVVHLLSGIATPATLGTALTIDLRTMEMERLPVLRDPECPVCGSCAPNEPPSAAGP